MTQSLYDGDELEWTATGAVDNGELLIIGNTPMVALESATGSGQKITVATEGVFLLTKEATATGSVGQGNKAYYGTTTDGTKVATTAATSGQCIGLLAETTTTGATSCRVKLVGRPLLVAI